MIKVVMIKTLERIINHAISLDPDHVELLSPLQEKPLTLVLEDWRLALTFIPQPNAFKLSTNQADQARTAIKGNVGDLLPLVFAQSPQAALMESGLHIQGQVHILDKYQTFFKQLDIDWEGQLAKRVGPSFARAIFNPLRLAKQKAQKQLSAAKTDLPEWLQEEVRLVPTRVEIENLYQDIALLREQLDRLELKVSQLA